MHKGKDGVKSVRVAEKPEKTSRVRAVVEGRGQGGFFRAWTQEEASQLRLTGWVRNLPDGNVELLAEGSMTALEELVKRCHSGPLAAQVSEVKTHWEDPQGDLSPFKIRYD